MKAGGGREIRLGRAAAVLVVWLLASWTTAEQVPKWSARSGYYAAQRTEPRGWRDADRITAAQSK
jgi:hypothetical protein